MAMVAGGASDAPALTRSCGTDPVANTANVLCASPSGPCTATAVILSAAIDVTDKGCNFDVGGRALTIQKAFRMTGLGFVAIRNAGPVRITATGALKSRGDFVEPNGVIVSGGFISIISNATIALDSGAAIDVSGDPSGFVELQAGGADASGIGINLVHGSVLKGVGQSSFVDSGDRFSDGGTVVAFASGGGVFESAAIDLHGSNQGAGGELDIAAAGTVTVADPIDATGGGGDGGAVDIEAADALLVAKAIDVSSTRGGGFGGSIDLYAGLDETGVPGGPSGGAFTLDMATGASLKADGSDGPGWSGDGGYVSVSARGRIQFINAGSGAAVHVDGGSSYDSGGGSLYVDSTDSDLFHIGPLDGDVVLNGVIHAVGGRLGGFGGDVELFAGRTLTVNSDIVENGVLFGGIVSAESKGAMLLNGTIDVHGTVATSAPGAADFVAGLAQGGAGGALTIAKNVLGSAGSSNSDRSELFFAACSLTVNAGVKIDGTGGTSPTNVRGGDAIDLIAAGPMNLGVTSKILAPPAGTIVLTHPPGQPPQTTGAILTPTPLDNPLPVTSGVYPNCPVCGDGIRQLGEVCDNGPTADGACCNATCSAFTCVP